MQFPALEAVEAQLKQIFTEAGPDFDLSNVKSLTGTSTEKAAQIHALNDSLEQLQKVARAAESGGGHESGDGARRDAGSYRSGGIDYKSLERLGKSHSVAAWVKARGATDFDVNAGWDAFAKGVVGNDWQPWQANFAAKAMSTAEPGGGYLVPDVLSANVIDRMRASTPIFAAGATTVPMTASTLDIARVTGDPTASWHAESAAITATDATLDRVRFTARTLPVLVKASRELAEDAPNLGAVVSQAIGGAIGAELTRVALRGSGTAPEPRGIRNQTGVEIFAFGVNGGPLTIDSLIDRVTTIRIANAEPNAMIFAPRTDGGLSKLSKDSNGNYFPLPAPLDKLGRFVTSVIPTTLDKGTSLDTSEVYVGDFTQLLIGMRASLRIEPLRERFADTGEYAFLAWMRADVQLEHGEAFSVISDTTT